MSTYTGSLILAITHKSVDHLVEFTAEDNKTKVISKQKNATQIQFDVIANSYEALIDALEEQFQFIRKRYSNRYLINGKVITAYGKHTIYNTNDHLF